MAKIKIAEDGSAMFKCPGCGHIHRITFDKKGKKPIWDFNNNLEKPTFKPSILTTSGHYVSWAKIDPKNCPHCKEAEKDGVETWCFRCHSFVTDGKIKFLKDCTHKLAGQTVDLLDWEEK